MPNEKKNLSLNTLYQLEQIKLVKIKVKMTGDVLEKLRQINCCLVLKDNFKFAYSIGYSHFDWLTFTNSEYSLSYTKVKIQIAS